MEDSKYHIIYIKLIRTGILQSKWFNFTPFKFNGAMNWTNKKMLQQRFFTKKHPFIHIVIFLVRKCSYHILVLTRGSSHLGSFTSSHLWPAWHTKHTLSTANDNYQFCGWLGTILVSIYKPPFGGIMIIGCPVMLIQSPGKYVRRECTIWIWNNLDCN